MIGKSDIEKLKDRKTRSITSTQIAEASRGKVSAPEVRRFFSFRTLPLPKQLEIVKITNALIKAQEAEVRKALKG